MATYRAIQDFVRARHGTVVQTCWIAHAKELHGLPVRTASNRHGSQRVKPCPPEKLSLIEEAFRHFGMVR